MLAVNKSAITAIVSLLVLAGAVAAESASVAGADEDTPRYTTAGELQVPPRFREWVFLSSGMDMNYKHAFAAGSPGTPTFGGAGNPNDRIAFSARPDGNIDIWDTFFYGKIGTITVRDPIIGPLRVARNAAGTRQWLFGVTASGLVMVELPVIVNPNPAPRR